MAKSNCSLTVWRRLCISNFSRQARLPRQRAAPLVGGNINRGGGAMDTQHRGDRVACECVQVCAAGVCYGWLYRVSCYGCFIRCVVVRRLLRRTRFRCKYATYFEIECAVAWYADVVVLLTDRQIEIFTPRIAWCECIGDSATIHLRVRIEDRSRHGVLQGTSGQYSQLCKSCGVPYALLTEIRMRGSYLCIFTPINIIIGTCNWESVDSTPQRIASLQSVVPLRTCTSALHLEWPAALPPRRP